MSTSLVYPKRTYFTQRKPIPFQLTNHSFRSSQSSEISSKSRVLSSSKETSDLKGYVEVMMREYKLSSQKLTHLVCIHVLLIL